jgi:hypothetical protein
MRGSGLVPGCRFAHPGYACLAADGKRHADRFEEFKRPSRLNENPGNIDQGIWEMVS